MIDRPSFRRALALGLLLTTSQLQDASAHPAFHPTGPPPEPIGAVVSSILAQDSSQGVNLAFEGPRYQVEVPYTFTKTFASFTTIETGYWSYTTTAAASTVPGAVSSSTQAIPPSTYIRTSVTLKYTKSRSTKSTATSTQARTTPTSSTSSSTPNSSVVVSSASSSSSSTSPPTSYVVETSSSSSAPPPSSSELPPITITTTLVSTTVITQLTTLSPSQVQTATPTASPQTTGTAISSLETSGEASSLPFATSVATSVSSTISLINTASTSLPTVATHQTTGTSMISINVFVPIQTDAPPAQISQRSDHPVPRLGVKSQSKKLETNKFYANFFLGDQADAVFTHPYSITWAKGAGGCKSWGLAISHVERSQLSFAPGSPPEYFINPLGLQPMILSAAELGNGTILTTDTLTAFSVNVNLLPSSSAKRVITFPVVQGMGFVTGVYSSATPLIQSSVSVLSLMYMGQVANKATYTYRANLNDGTSWVIYVTPSFSTYPGNSFTLADSQNIMGTAGFSGSIQIGKIPSTPAVSDSKTVYDSTAGTYPTTASISGSVAGNTGTYSLSWTQGGIASQKLLMWALPHHIASLASNTSITDLTLVTTTKGYATAVLGQSWTLVEPNLPIDMGFSPWTPSTGSIRSVSPAAAQLINQAGTYELSEDIVAQTDLNSMYYSGKGLAKFAAIVYALHDIAENKTLAYSGLQKLESAFATFVNNTQIFPLVYESAWGGAVSSATYQTGDSGADFGNSYYNDHHFHYGYFVYAAAVIGYLDPTWLAQGTNKAWVNMLVRDYANSIPNDPYFPMSRSFDWFHGHSWAKGLFESGDGKDQESSSEDSNAAYAIKMWGRTIGDNAMEARGNLMLAVQARSLQNYFLYQNNNTVEPPQIIPNKVSGIMFENKIDHTTYFGQNIEYIEGIHMLPLMPFSTLTRTKTFVTEEWNQYNFSSYAPTVVGGWKGILYANLAIIDPATSYAFFSDPNFDYNNLDGGASLTWYLTWSAALGGSTGTYGTSSKRAVEVAQAPALPLPETVASLFDESTVESLIRDGVTPPQPRQGHALSRFWRRLQSELERRGASGAPMR